MLVSVIIPTYNEEKDIAECLKSLKNQSYKNIEIIAVDDGSIDGTRDIIKKFRKVKLIEGQHKGPGFSRNLGARQAKGEILIFIDSDMTFDKSYIKNLIKPILKDKRIIGTTHDFEIATNTDNKWSSLWGKIRVSKENAKDVRIFRAIRKDKFLELGGFDPKYGYADDQTFWFKYKIKPFVAENTICYHKNPETLKGTYKQARWIGASWRERYAVFRIPILNYISIPILFVLMPFAVLLKSIKPSRANFLERIRFYFAKFYGYLLGVSRAIFMRKFAK